MFRYHTKETAPAESQSLIEASVKTYGFFPNLHQVLAEAPAAYKAYLETFSIFEKETTLTPLEQQIVFQTANYENNCHYCVPGHSYLMKAMRMPADVIEALREGQPIADPKLEALRVYARRTINQRGHLSDQEIQEFLAAGYNTRQALEVLVGLSSKLISNFTNALARTKLDAGVQAFAWTHPSQRQEQTTAAS
jgi:alkylhydroperoxidase family enzyme